MPNGQLGQTTDNQINLLGDLLTAVQGTDGSSGQLDEELVIVSNGYSRSADPKLVAFNTALTSKYVGADKGPAGREAALGHMRVGLHAGVEVRRPSHAHHK